MSFLFGRKKSPAELLRENKRMLDKSIREIERERQGLQTQEKRVIAEIKKSAKQGQMGAVKVMAKDLIRTRHQIEKFYKLKSQLQGVSLRIQTLKSTQSMGEAMKGVTKAMNQMNRQMNLPALQKIMMEFERQNEKMEMVSEAMGDAIDDAMEGDDEEEETEELVSQVLDEIGIDINSELLNAPSSTVSAQTAKNNIAQPATIGKDETGLDGDLQLQDSIVKQGINGSPYRILVGDTKELMRQIMEAWSKPISLSLPHCIASRVDPFTHHIIHNYGKVSFCWFGTSPRLIISDTELMKEVLSNKEGHFGKPYINPLVLILTKGLTTLEGEEWANHRRIINPAFHLEKLKGMILAFSTSCGKMIDQWGRQIDLQGGSNCEIDVWSEFQNLTGDIIFKAAFGNSSIGSNEGKEIFKLQKELLGLVMEAMMTTYIPGFRFIPTKKNRRRNELNRRITLMFQTIVQRQENEMRTGQSRADNLLGVLLESNQAEKKSVSREAVNGMTIDEIIEECKQFYLAGYETTSCLLTWTLIVLAMRQDWQQKARKEILEICGENVPVAEDIGRLKVTTMILNEVLRLYPPAIALYLHAYKKTRIGTLSIPAGVDITLPTLIIHHDKDLWGDDADDFKPERFSEGVLNASKGNQAFFPFGWGPRICIGQNFAMIESKVALAMILQHFSFKLSPSYSHTPYTVMTLQPQHGAQIIFEKLAIT